MTQETIRTDVGLHWDEPLYDGTFVRIRPLRPSDGEREWTFLKRLSSEQREYRFVGLVKPLDDALVKELTCTNPACEVELGAFATTGSGEIEIGAARYFADPDGLHCDCSVAVDPAWQKRGVGRALMRRLIDMASQRGIRRMYVVGGSSRAGAHAFVERLGFRSRPDPEDPLVTTFELVLDRQPAR